MKQAVIIDCVRTPIGRAHAEVGFFRDVRSDDLAVSCVKTLVERTGIDPAEIEDVVMGNSQQTAEQGVNVARMIGLMAGLGVQASGTTVNRLCGSSLQALNQAVHSIRAGCEDVHIVGGLEHMHHVPMDHGIDINTRLFQHTSRAALLMGVTAEFLAQSQGISRQEQDEFALASHHKAIAAHDAGWFEKEIVPIYGKNAEGGRIQVDRDQSVRTDTDMEKLSALKPAFMPGAGTVTAGNSSPTNDGAAAMLVMSEEKASQLGLEPIARVRSTAVAGVEPALMGTGPVPATTRALERAGVELEDIDLVELNEAFSAQSIACLRMLDLDAGKVNVQGGAIAIGHPLGASGARIATTLVHAMQRNNVELGLATMCIGVGQGIATVLERVG